MKKLKNPPLYEYGYHITKHKNLDSILTEGLKVNRNYQSYKNSASELIAQQIYNNKIPLYFWTSNFIEKNWKYVSQHLLKSMLGKHTEYKEVLKKPKIVNTNLNIKQFVSYERKLVNRPILLKVNVTNFNQLPDLDVLLMENKFQFRYDSNLDAINFSSREWDPFAGSNVIYSELPSKLQKWIRYYDWIIPVKEFKTNQKLIIDLISLTHVFCIAEDIPAKNIVDVIELPDYHEYIQKFRK